MVLYWQLVTLAVTWSVAAAGDRPTTSPHHHPWWDEPTTRSRSNTLLPLSSPSAFHRLSQGVQDDPRRPQGAQGDPQRPQGVQDDPQRSQGVQDDPRRPQGAQSGSRYPQGVQGDLRRTQGVQTDPQRPQGVQSDPRRPQGAQSYPRRRPKVVQSDPKPSGSSQVGQIDPWWYEVDPRVWFDPQFSGNHRWGHERSSNTSDPSTKFTNNTLRNKTNRDSLDYMIGYPTTKVPQGSRNPLMSSKHPLEDVTSHSPTDILGGHLGLMSLFVSAVTILFMVISSLGVNVRSPFDVSNVFSGLGDRVPPLKSEKVQSRIADAVALIFEKISREEGDRSRSKRSSLVSERERTNSVIPVDKEDTFRPLDQRLGRQFDPLSQIAMSAAMVLGAYAGYAIINTNKPSSSVRKMNAKKNHSDKGMDQRVVSEDIHGHTNVSVPNTDEPDFIRMNIPSNHPNHNTFAYPRPFRNNGTKQFASSYSNGPTGHQTDHLRPVRLNLVPTPHPDGPPQEPKGIKYAADDQHPEPSDSGALNPSRLGTPGLSTAVHYYSGLIRDALDNKRLESLPVINLWGTDASQEDRINLNVIPNMKGSSPALLPVRDLEPNLTVITQSDAHLEDPPDLYSLVMEEATLPSDSTHQWQSSTESSDPSAKSGILEAEQAGEGDPEGHEEVRPSPVFFRPETPKPYQPEGQSSEGGDAEVFPGAEISPVTPGRPQSQVSGSHEASVVIQSPELKFTPETHRPHGLQLQKGEVQGLVETFSTYVRPRVPKPQQYEVMRPESDGAVDPSSIYVQPTVPVYYDQLVTSPANPAETTDSLTTHSAPGGGKDTHGPPQGSDDGHQIFYSPPARPPGKPGTYASPPWSRNQDGDDDQVSGHDTEEDHNDVRQPGTYINGQQPGTYFNSHQPGTSIDGHQPGTYFNSHQPGTSIDGHQSGMHINSHQPDTSINGHQPQTYVNSHQPGTSIDGHQPGTYISHQPGTSIDGHQPGITNSHQPDTSINGHQPETYVNSHQPGISIDGHKPGTYINSHQPGISINGHQPQTYVNSHQPGTSIDGHQPGTYISHQPGTSIDGHQPGITNSHQPDTSINGHEPETYVNSHQPGTSIDGHRPGTYINSHQSGTSIDGYQSGTHINGQQPGTPIDGHRPGTYFNSQQPGTSIDGHQPGTHINSQQSGTSIDGHQPGTHINSQQPGTSIDGHQPGTHINSQQPGTSIDGHQPSMYINSQQPGTSIDGHQPSMYINSQQPGTSIDGHQPGTHIKSHQPGTSIDGHQPGTHINSHQPGTSINGHQPGLYINSLQPGTSIEGHQPGIYIKITIPGHVPPSSKRHSSPGHEDRTPSYHLDKNYKPEAHPGQGNNVHNTPPQLSETQHQSHDLSSLRPSQLSTDSSTSSHSWFQESVPLSVAGHQTTPDLVSSQQNTRGESNSPGHTLTSSSSFEVYHKFSGHRPQHSHPTHGHLQDSSVPNDQSQQTSVPSDYDHDFNLTSNIMLDDETFKTLLKLARRELDSIRGYHSDPLRDSYHRTKGGNVNGYSVSTEVVSNAPHRLKASENVYFDGYKIRPSLYVNGRRIGKDISTLGEGLGNDHDNISFPSELLHSGIHSDLDEFLQALITNLNSTSYHPGLVIPKYISRNVTHQMQEFSRVSHKRGEDLELGLFVEIITNPDNTTESDISSADDNNDNTNSMRVKTDHSDRSRLKVLERPTYISSFNQSSTPATKSFTEAQKYMSRRRYVDSASADERHTAGYNQPERTTPAGGVANWRPAQTLSTWSSIAEDRLMHPGNPGGAALLPTKWSKRNNDDGLKSLLSSSDLPTDDLEKASSPQSFHRSGSTVWTIISHPSKASTSNPALKKSRNPKRPTTVERSDPVTDTMKHLRFWENTEQNRTTFPRDRGTDSKTGATSEMPAVLDVLKKKSLKPSTTSTSDASPQIPSKNIQRGTHPSNRLGGPWAQNRSVRRKNKDPDTRQAETTSAIPFLSSTVVTPAQRHLQTQPTSRWNKWRKQTPVYGIDLETTEPPPPSAATARDDLQPPPVLLPTVVSQNPDHDLGPQSAHTLGSPSAAVFASNDIRSQPFPYSPIPPQTSQYINSPDAESIHFSDSHHSQSFPFSNSPPSHSLRNRYSPPINSHQPADPLRSKSPHLAQLLRPSTSPIHIASENSFTSPSSYHRSSTEHNLNIPIEPPSFILLSSSSEKDPTTRSKFSSKTRPKDSLESFHHTRPTMNEFINTSSSPKESTETLLSSTSPPYTSATKDSPKVSGSPYVGLMSKFLCRHALYHEVCAVCMEEVGHRPECLLREP